MYVPCLTKKTRRFIVEDNVPQQEIWYPPLFGQKLRHCADAL